jgi:adenosylcobinamide-GDP ribazoletransferase
VAAVVLEAVRAVTRSATGTLLAAVLAVATLALLTRALHWDGLADTADGLGSALPAPGALEVMRRSDVGPFGVVAVVLVLLLQVSALAAAVGHGYGWLCLLVSTTTGRTAAAVACARGIPAARGSGLGAMVAGTVPRPAALVLAVAVVAAAAGAGAVDDDATVRLVARAGGAVLLGLGVAALLLLRCIRRLGGVTGDVLGALVETATAAALVGFAVVRP